QFCSRGPGLKLDAGWGQELEAGGPLGDDEQLSSAKVLEHPHQRFLDGVEEGEVAAGAGPTHDQAIFGTSVVRPVPAGVDGGGNHDDVAVPTGKLVGQKVVAAHHELAGAGQVL